MGRSTSAQQQATDARQQSNEAYKSATGDIGAYRANMERLRTGKDIGADPFTQTRYLANVNKLQSEALNTAAGSSKAEMARRLKATGGLNASQTALGQRDVGLETGRLADTLSARRAAEDYKANLEYQKYLAASPLAAAGQEGNLYATAETGETNANRALLDYYGGIFKGLEAGPCWIAAELYGEFDWRTNLLRSWLTQEFSERWYGRAIVSLYRRFGERLASGVRRFYALRALVRPVFDFGLERACHERRHRLKGE